jgi:hypothetical protein
MTRGRSSEHECDGAVHALAALQFAGFVGRYNSNDVCKGSITSLQRSPHHVRNSPESGNQKNELACRLSARSRHHAFRGTCKCAMARHRRETSSLNYDLSFDRARRLIKAPTRFCESFSSKSTGKSDTGPASTELMRTRNSSFSVSLRSFSVELFAVEIFSAFWVIFCMTVPCRFRPTTRGSKRC